jgi:tetratricopeptide (TPR) repeat protein
MGIVFHQKKPTQRHRHNEMNLSGKKITFHRKEKNENFHPFRIVFLLTIIFGLVFLVRALDSGAVRRPYDPTATPTRTNQSFILEAETHFQSGNLPAAITAYQKALAVDPSDANLYSELARIQVYSSASLSTDDEKKLRLQEALDTINNGVKVAPDDSNIHAVRAFVLDWNSNPVIAGDNSKTILTEAEQEAVRAIQLDNQNALAKAYFAEVSIDELKYTQAEQNISQALKQDPTIMDLYRINGQLWEIKGNYLNAIEEYKKAIDIMPNLTFLYIYVGLNYRVLAANDPTSPYYTDSLSYFAKAVTINETLGIQDPMPYLAIAKTYSQMGEFYIASLNGQKALAMNPTNPDVYGQLGIIYYKGKNYEGSIPALKCAILGCTPPESCEARQCNSDTDPQITIEGMPLSNSTVVYYYTYGSVLAGLSIPQSNNCGEALDVFNQIKAKYNGDKDIMSIVAAGEQICASVDSTSIPNANITPAASGVATITLAGKSIMTATPEPKGTATIPYSTP